jgi:hypothetical protein
MKKLVPFTSLTRRKLIKLIRKFGESYYVFDGANYAREDAIMRDLEFWSKDQLQDLYRDILVSAYDKVFSDSYAELSVLMCFVEVFASAGVSTPAYHELPTDEGMKLIRSGLRLLTEATDSGEVPSPFFVK